MVYCRDNRLLQAGSVFEVVKPCQGPLQRLQAGVELLAERDEARRPLLHLVEALDDAVGLPVAFRPPTRLLPE